MGAKVRSHVSLEIDVNWNDVEGKLTLHEVVKAYLEEALAEYGVEATATVRTADVEACADCGRVTYQRHGHWQCDCTADAAAMVEDVREWA